MGEAAIVVRGLRKRFGAQEAVAGIDLGVAAGSCAGLVGPNGAGKTTSLSMMTGLLRPDGGQVVINGHDVWSDPRAAKAVIGVVPAGVRLFDRLSGAELLEYAGRLRGLPAAQARDRAGQLLAVLDLTADAGRLVADYSTGMRKKAALGAVEGRLRPVSFAGMDRWLRWLPPGLAAHAVRYASAGRTGTAMVCLLLLAAVTVALGWLWLGILRRALVTVDTTTQSSAVRQAGLPFAGFGLRGAVAARFWIYQRREPSSLIYWGIVAVVMIAASASSLLTPSYRGALLSSAGIGAALLAIFHSNSAGMTGPAFVHEAMAMTSRRAPPAPPSQSCRNCARQPCTAWRS